MLFLASYLVPGASLFALTQSSLLAFTGVIFAFFIVPIIELFYHGRDTSFVEGESIWHDIIIFSHVLLFFVLLFLFLNLPSSDVLTRLGHVLSMGIVFGVTGINVAHELGHRKDRFSIISSQLLLLFCQYYQFRIDHNKGHHKHVATKKDPSSAPKQMNLYFFWLRSIVGTTQSAWKINRQELTKALIIQVFIIALIFYCGRVELLLNYLAAALIGILLLESVNYIEHYGLVRQLKSSGRYEPVRENHSWNSNHSLGRALLFNLSRHSDHHYMVNRKYHSLRSVETSRQMPTGYPGMIVLAMLPWAWYKVIHPRLSEQT